MNTRTIEGILNALGFTEDRVTAATNILTSSEKLQKPREPLLSPAELKRHLGISTTTLWRLAKAGLPFHRVGGRKRFELAEVVRFLDEKEKA